MTEQESFRTWLVDRIANLKEEMKNEAHADELPEYKTGIYELEQTLDKLDTEIIPKLNEELHILGGYGVPYVARDRVRDVITDEDKFHYKGRND